MSPSIGGAVNSNSKLRFQFPAKREPIPYAYIETFYDRLRRLRCKLAIVTRKGWLEMSALACGRIKIQNRRSGPMANSPKKDAVGLLATAR
jgi:hypothetical protein